MELLNCIQWVWIIIRWWRWSSGSDSECRAKEKSWELWEDRWGRGEELYDLSHRSSIRRHPTGDGSKWGLNGRQFAWAEGSIFRWKGSCHKMPTTMWKGTYLMGKLQPSKWKRSLQASRRTRAPKVDIQTWENFTFSYWGPHQQYWMLRDHRRIFFSCLSKNKKF